ncbi:MAG: type II toxin-antitoxin system VapB family antitoxin [Cyanobacteria bacterium J06621_8]
METAKLFKNGQSQAVRLPKKYRFQGDQVIIKRVGNAVVLLPYENSWDTFFNSLEVTLVTNNVREFNRLPNLQLDNWAD